MNHPLQQSTINQIAQDILQDFIENQDVSDVIANVAQELVEEIVPCYKNKRDNNLHVEIAGVIMMELVEYIKRGYYLVKNQPTMEEN